MKIHRMFRARLVTEGRRGITGTLAWMHLDDKETTHRLVWAPDANGLKLDLEAPDVVEEYSNGERHLYAADHCWFVYNDLPVTGDVVVTKTLALKAMPQARAGGAMTKVKV